MTNLDTLVWDLGNVLIRWDPAAAFHGVLDPDDVQAFLAEVDFAAWNHLQDAGRPWHEGVTELSARFPHRATAIASYVPNFLATLEEMPDSVALLHRLQRAGVRQLALTNWSADLFTLARDRFGFLQTFEGIVVSGEEGVAKPEPELFRILLRRYGVDASSAAFVDDSAANVRAARQVGLTGIGFTDAASLEAALRGIGLLPADA